MVGIMSEESNLKSRNILWVEPSHYRLDKALHKMADIEISKQLAKRKISIHMMVIRSERFVSINIGDSQVRTISVPIKYVPLFSSVMYAIALLFYLPVYIIKLAPRVVMVAPDVSIFSFIPALFLCKLKHTKIVLDVRSVPVELSGFVGFLQKFWFDTSIFVARQFFDGITVITSLMKTDLCNQFNLNSQKVGVWTSGVSTDLFNPQKYCEEGQKLKAELGLSGRFIVFYHGVFSATRGLDETIEAIKLLKPKYPAIVFFLLGNGPILDRLKALIQKEGLQENVIIHNPVEQLEVPKFIDFCDVGIVPLPYNVYWRSQSPLKLLEYLSMQKVVLISDIPAHRLVVNEEKCAIYFSSVKPVEIAKSIEYAYNNCDRLLSWGNVGREIIQREYTWEKVAKDLENYLVSI
jgi:glycosyltransferase involved in cell wall biosynthesis